MANNVDPDTTSIYAASYLGLHRLNSPAFVNIFDNSSSLNGLRFSRSIAFPARLGVGPAKNQIGVRICKLWSVLAVRLRTIRLLVTHGVFWEYSDQSVLRHSLIRVFTERTFNLVENGVHRLFVLIPFNGLKLRCPLSLVPVWNYDTLAYSTCISTCCLKDLCSRKRSRVIVWKCGNIQEGCIPSTSRLSI